MGPITRSKTTLPNIDNDLEKITDTLDPIQKTFITQKDYIPFWRYVLYQRYIGTFKPKTVSSSWTIFVSLHRKIESDYATDFITIPNGIHQTTIELRKGHLKLLKIHLYYTTGKILVQGKACNAWVDEEFRCLQAIVHTLALSGESPSQLALSDMQRPDNATARAILEPAVYPGSQDDSALLRKLYTRTQTTCTSGITPGDLILATPNSTVHSGVLTTTHPSTTALQSAADTADHPPASDDTVNPDTDTRPTITSPPNVSTITPAKTTTIPVDTSSPTTTLVNAAIPSENNKDCVNIVSDTREIDNVVVTESVSVDKVCDRDCVSIDDDDDDVSVCDVDSVNCQCHADCVPLAVHAATTADLQAQITVLRASVLEMREHYKTELDHLHTIIRHLKNTDCSQKSGVGKNKAHSPGPSKRPPPSRDSESRVQTVHNGTQSSSTLIDPQSVPDTPVTNVTAAKEPSPPPLPTQSEAHLSPSVRSQLSDRVNSWPELPPLSNDTGTVLLGDFAVEGLHERKMAVDKEKPKLLSIRDLATPQLISLLNSSLPQTQITTAVVHVGANDCSWGHVVGKKAWRAVASAARRCFPKATLIFSTILPDRDNPCIAPSNSNLSEVCKALQIRCVDNDAAFCRQDGSPIRALFADRLRPNRRGASTLAIAIKRQYSATNPNPVARARAPDAANRRAPSLPPLRTRKPLLPSPPPPSMAHFPPLPSRPRPTQAPSGRPPPPPSLMTTAPPTERPNPTTKSEASNTNPPQPAMPPPPPPSCLPQVHLPHNQTETDRPAYPAPPRYPLNAFPPLAPKQFPNPYLSPFTPHAGITEGERSLLFSLLTRILV